MSSRTPIPPFWGDTPQPVIDDLAFLRTGIVNLYFYGQPGAGDREWVLIDTGLPGAAGAIKRAAEQRFGPTSRPAAILLTHGHFDHVGTVQELAEHWDAPVWAHEMELPYLTGQSSYPPSDPTVGGGGMAALAWTYPRRPIDLGDRVQALPEDGSVPEMPGWWLFHSPGHTPGHVSFFRETDRVLISGDAVITTKQESVIAALTQRPEVHGPPAYFTPDWESARQSVTLLAALEPEVLAPGHGVPLRGEKMRQELRRLDETFEELAVPSHGRYAYEPAVADERGVVWVPPMRPWHKTVLGAGAAALLGGVAYRVLGKRS